MPVIYFKEKQLLRKTRFMIVVSVFSVFIFFVTIFTLLQLLSVNNSFFQEKTAAIIFRISEIISVFTLYILITGYLMKMETIITAKGIKYRILPFVIKSRSIKKESISEYTLHKSSKLKDFGGWSFRRSFGRKRGIYMITGETAIRFIMKDGSKVILGTQKPEVFLKGLERMNRHKKHQASINIKKWKGEKKKK